MKIYFSAAHSSGKTTLARHIAHQYQLPLIHEIARQVLSEKELQFETMRANIDVVDQYQTEVFERQLLEETKYDNFISDRCIVDSLAYTASHSRVLAKLLTSEKLQTNVKALRQSDTLIFFIRPCKATLKNDGIRENVNWDQIVSIDAQIKLLFEMFELRYFQINAESMQERIRLVENVISLVKKK